MGKIVIDAAIRQGVENFVFAGVPEANRLTNGEVPILSLGNKNTITNYGRKAGFGRLCRGEHRVDDGYLLDGGVRQYFGCFATNPDKEGSLTLGTFPMSNSAERIPWTSVRDNLGDAVNGLLLHPGRYDKRTVWAISKHPNFQDVKFTTPAG